MQGLRHVNWGGANLVHDVNIKNVVQVLSDVLGLHGDVFMQWI